MTTLLPKDADNNAIPALRLKEGGAHKISFTAASARNTQGFDSETKVIGLYASEPVYIAFGDETVTASASDHYFPAGVYYDIAISGGSGKGPHHSHIAVLRAETNGTLYISEKV